MTLLHVVILAIVQGLAELLPVSSSAHVIVVAKLLGLDPTAPEMTLLLVMLHTGTMFAVIVYFWRRWQQRFFSSDASLRQSLTPLVISTCCTLAVAGPLMLGIPHLASHLGLIGLDEHGHPRKAEVEALFGNLPLIASALAAVGVLILMAGWRERAQPGTRALSTREAVGMGLIQGLCIPLRGFSRSGATISVGMLMGTVKARAEEFSFALAVIITPLAIIWELHRALKEPHASIGTLLLPGLVGVACAFMAGMIALRWLSGWLEQGLWYLFGIYCLVAAAVVFALHAHGY
jgi:undecaprenyl-diphosphatase